MSYKNETVDQARIRRAFANCPYGGSAGLNFMDEMDFKTIADNLEKLLPRIADASQRAMDESKELRQLNLDIAATRRILGLTVS